MFRAFQVTVAELWYVLVLSSLLCLGNVCDASGAAKEITAQGTLDAQWVEVRCELPPQYASATTIAEVVTEGKIVDAGDVLIRLDSSHLKNERLEQQLKVMAGEVELVKTRNALKVSQIARAEFLEGTYIERKASAEAAVVLAKVALEVAQKSLELAEKRSSENKTPADELAGRRNAVMKAKQELVLAEIRLRVLENYTKQKMEAMLDGAVTLSEVDLDLAKARHQFQMQRLENLKDAIEKCAIRASSKGRVYYCREAPSQPGRVIRPGHKVRAGQVLLRLYNSRTMQFRAMLSKDEAKQIREGMSATIRLDALPDLSLKGRVKNVPANPRKKMMVRIEITNPSDRLRPGLTGQASITVAASSKATP
ncbi:MAG: HlyD family efflux transporter periplasmic adaptor subunit [Pirellulales bacterium]|nr:HlyD family efflux transporter periplasmic adaptor subunit [Pirellulales bacterium]